MHNTFRHSQPQRNKNRLEIVKTELTDWRSNHHLPRHISVLETKSHRDPDNLSGINYAPRTCRINVEDSTQPNLILDILKYQLSDRIAKQKHWENVRANLNRRLKIAKAEGNNQLVSILQAEYKQLEITV